MRRFLAKEIARLKVLQGTKHEEWAKDRIVQLRRLWSALRKNDNQKKKQERKEE